MTDMGQERFLNEKKVVDKFNQQLKKVQDSLKDASFLKHDLTVTSVSGIGVDGKVSRVGVIFPEKGSAELRKKLKQLGWEKTDRRQEGRIDPYDHSPKSFYIQMEYSLRYDKYAIYQGTVGKYAMDYLPNIQDYRIEDYLFCNTVGGGDFPLVVNRQGGKHRFIAEQEENFLEIVEVLEGEEPLALQEMYPRNAESFQYGFIAPNGDTYSCGYTDHVYCADAICKQALGMGYCSNAERELEELGWVKVTRDLWNNKDGKPLRIAYFDSDTHRMTRNQIDTLIQTGIYGENREVREFVDLMMQRNDREQDEYDR